MSVNWRSWNNWIFVQTTQLCFPAISLCHSKLIRWRRFSIWWMLIFFLHSSSKLFLCIEPSNPMCSENDWFCMETANSIGSRCWLLRAARRVIQVSWKCLFLLSVFFSILFMTFHLTLCKCKFFTSHCIIGRGCQMNWKGNQMDV